MCRSILLFTFSICLSGLSAQVNLPRGKAWAIAPHYGFIAAHSAQMEHLIQGHSRGIQGQLLWAPNEKKEWVRLYNYPDIGLDLFINHTGNKEQLGIQSSSTFFIDLPLNRSRGTESLPTPEVSNTKICAEPFHRLGLGIGLGYSTKTWDLEANRQAAVIGSKMNIAIVLQYKINVLSFGHVDLQSGLRITHFSNGAWQLPNLGTNNISIYAAFRYKDQRYLESMKHPSQILERDFSKSWHSTLSLSFGLKEIPPPYGKKHSTISMSFLEDYHLSPKSSVGLGADLFRNSSIGVLLERRDSVLQPLDMIQAGLIASYTLHFEYFELKMQQGIYIIDQWKDNGLFYHRFGLRYKVSQNWFLHLMLKTHFAKADHGELGFGYSF